MNELQIYRCSDCGGHVFPERLRCPGCGGRRFERVAAGPGRVEERTLLRGGRKSLAAVRLTKGPVVIARSGETVGGEVRLVVYPDGAIEAQEGQ